MMSRRSSTQLPPIVPEDTELACPLRDLPDHILAHVVSHLSLADRTNVTLVCRRLCRIGRSYQAGGISLRFPNSTDANDDYYQFLQAWRAAVTHVHVAVHRLHRLASIRWGQQAVAGLLLAIRSCEKTNRIVVSDRRHRDDVGATEFIEGVYTSIVGLIGEMERLEHVVVNGSVHEWVAMNDVVKAAVASGFTRLRTLHVDISIKETNMVEMLESLAPTKDTLVRLHIGNMDRSDSGDNDIIAVDLSPLTQHTHLTKLTIVSARSSQKPRSQVHVRKIPPLPRLRHAAFHAATVDMRGLAACTAITHLEFSLRLYRDANGQRMWQHVVLPPLPLLATITGAACTMDVAALTQHTSLTCLLLWLGDGQGAPAPDVILPPLPTLQSITLDVQKIDIGAISVCTALTHVEMNWHVCPPFTCPDITSTHLQHVALINRNSRNENTPPFWPMQFIEQNAETLRHVEVIDISWQIPVDFFGPFHALKTLVLNFTDLGLNPQTHQSEEVDLGFLRQLESLTIDSEEHIVNVILPSSGALKEVELIDAIQLCVTSIPSSVATLKIARCPRVPNTALSGCVALRELTLEHMEVLPGVVPVGWADVLPLMGLPSLKSVSLTEMPTIDLFPLVSCPRLKTVEHETEGHAQNPSVLQLASLLKARA